MQRVPSRSRNKLALRCELCKSLPRESATINHAALRPAKAIHEQNLKGTLRWESIRTTSHDADGRKLSAVVLGRDAIKEADIRPIAKTLDWSK